MGCVCGGWPKPERASGGWTIREVPGPGGAFRIFNQTSWLGRRTGQTPRRGPMAASAAATAAIIWPVAKTVSGPITGFGI